MTTKPKRINLKVSAPTYEWLKQRSSELSITMTELINRLLLASIREHEEVNEPNQL